VKESGENLRSERRREPEIAKEHMRGDMSEGSMKRLCEAEVVDDLVKRELE
jgi:hypothetical protein